MIFRILCGRDGYFYCIKEHIDRVIKYIVLEYYKYGNNKKNKKR
jgi:hypothetical protein